ncbi:MAG: thiamine phosphate synthase [Clostridiales bacterium]|nr:thiamine phosphate synthase [Clostridiales bacterium]
MANHDRYNDNTPNHDRFHCIIAVSNRHLCSRPFSEQIRRVCRCHPRALILREKDLPEEEYLLLAREIQDICDAYQVPCILHTFWQVAIELNSPYIHLPLPVLRKCRQNQAGDDVLSSFTEIGTSVHSVADMKEAERLGATYVTAGHIFSTDCKKGVPPRGLGFLKDVCQSSNIPVYAIGGIHLEGDQLARVMDCGAAGGCIMSGIMKL